MSICVYGFTKSIEINWSNCCVFNFDLHEKKKNRKRSNINSLKMQWANKRTQTNNNNHFIAYTAYPSKINILMCHMILLQFYYIYKLLFVYDFCSMHAAKLRITEKGPSLYRK